MKLVFPDIRYKEKAIRFIDEFRAYGSEPNGNGALERYLEEATYEEWLRKVIADIDVANVPPERVPALTYFGVREEDDEIVGMINLRLALNDFLRTEGGHVGYGVRPTERGKHYATEMLRAALRVYDTFGIREIILTCDKANRASAATIRSCGGELSAEFHSDTFGCEVQRYIIRR